jgi:hypothetical protein
LILNADLVDRYTDKSRSGAFLTGSQNREEEIMATNTKTIGQYVQLGGVAAFALGAVLSLHHVAIGAAFVGGVAAFYVGRKIQAMTAAPTSASAPKTR